MTKLTLKLLVLAVVLGMLALLMGAGGKGGWKWRGHPSAASEPTVYAVADAHGTPPVAEFGWTWD